MYSVNHGKFYKKENFKFVWIFFCFLHFIFNYYFHYFSVELFLFGYTIYLIPILYNNIYIFIGIFFIFLALDTQTFFLFPYKFCGIIGELILFVDKIVLLFIIAILILILIYLLFKVPVNKLGNSTHIKKINLENKLLKLFNSKYLNLEITKVKYGQLCDFYYIETKTPNLYILIQDICLENGITARLAKYADRTLLETNKTEQSTFKIKTLMNQNIKELCVFSPIFGFFPINESVLFYISKDNMMQLTENLVNIILHFNEEAHITIVTNENLNLKKNNNLTFVEENFIDDILLNIAKEMDLRQTQFITRVKHAKIILIDLCNEKESDYSFLKDLKKTSDILIFKFCTNIQSCSIYNKLFKHVLVSKTDNKYNSVLALGYDGCEFLSGNKYDFIYLDKSTNEIYRTYFPEY